MSPSDERRKLGNWNLDENSSEEVRQIHALFNYLVNEGEIQEIDTDVKETLDRLRFRKEELENEYEETESPSLITQIEQIDEELSEYDQYMDVYDIEPDGDFDFMNVYWVEKLGAKYAVGDEYDIEKTTKNSLEEMFDSEGYNGLPDWILESNIDTDDVVRYATDLYENWVWDSPEDYLEDEDRDLSKEQQMVYQVYLKKTQEMKKRIEMFEKILDKQQGDKKNQIQSMINQLKETVDEMGKEMREIESDPQGDFNELKIESYIERMVEQVSDDPLGFIKDYDLTISNFINQEGVIEDIISEDGYTHISTYDGAVGEEIISGETFYIVRLD